MSKKVREGVAMHLYLGRLFILLGLLILFPMEAFSVPIIPRNMGKALPPLSKGLKRMPPEQCRQKLKKDPRNPSLHACIALDAMRKKRWEEAVASWKEAIQHLKGKGGGGYAIGLATSYLNIGKAKQAEATVTKALRINPASMMLHYWLAVFWEREKQPEKAKAAYGKILPLTPSPERPLEYFYHAHSLVEAAGNINKFAQARKDLEALLKALPDHLDGWTLLGYLYVKMGKPARAVEALDKGEAIKKGHLPIQLLLAQALLMMRKADAAIDHGRQVLEQVPNHLAANYLVGTAHLMRGEKEQGIEYLNKARAGEDGLGQASLVLGKAYLSEGKLDEAGEILKDLSKQAPEDPAIQASLITLFIQAGKLDDAIKQSDQILKRDHDNHLIASLKASALLSSKKTGEAERVLTGILRKNSMFLPAQIEQIRLYMMREKFDLASRAVDRMIEERPKEAVGYRIKGDLALAKGEKGSALTAFKKVVEMKPNDIRLWSKIFSLQLQEKAFPEAEETADQLIQRFPRFPGGHFARGMTLLQQKKHQAAEGSFQKALDLNEDHFRSHNYLGIMKAKSLPETAIRHFEKSLDIFPRQPLIYFQLAGLYVKGGDTEKGLKTAKRWADLFPDKGGPHALMSNVLLADKKREEAITHLTKAISLEPQRPSFYLNLGSVYQRGGEYKKAVHLYEDALKNIPNHPILMNNLAWNYTEIDQAKKALPLAKKAEEMRPDDWTIKDTVGWVYYKDGNYEAATKKLKEAIALNDQHPTLQYHIALAYLAADEKEIALRHLKKAEGVPGSFPEKEEVARLIELMKE